MTVVAGLAGGMVVAGVLLLVLELTRRAPAPGTPVRASWRPDVATGRRLILALAAGLLMLAISRWPVAAIATAGSVMFLPRIMSTRAARQRVEVLEGLEQWIRRVSDMLTASRGLEEALESSARSAPAAVRPAVAGLARRLAARGGAEAALRAFAAEINDPAGDRIAAALIIATGRRGGAVRDVLSSLAAMLGRDVAARREIEAERAQHRTTVKWLAAFVVGFAIFALLNRSYSAPYGTAPGEVVMALVVALYAGGLGWLHRLGSVPVPGRFLAGQPDAAGAAGAPGATGTLDLADPGDLVRPR
jgi:Flp pilus assembly protein TadB